MKTFINALLGLTHKKTPVSLPLVRYEFDMASVQMPRSHTGISWHNGTSDGSMTFEKRNGLLFIDGAEVVLDCYRTPKPKRGGLVMETYVQLKDSILNVHAYEFLKENPQYLPDGIESNDKKSAHIAFMGTASHDEYDNTHIPMLSSVKGELKGSWLWTGYLNLGIAFAERAQHAP